MNLPKRKIIRLQNYDYSSSGAYFITVCTQNHAQILSNIVLVIAIGVFLVIATLTEGAGQFGELIDNFLKGLFGFVAYILPFYLILFGILLFSKKTVSISLKTTALVFVLLLMIATMNSVHFINVDKISFDFESIKMFYENGIDLKSGGLFGMFIATLLIKWFGVNNRNFYFTRYCCCR